ncbi:MAG: peptide chain release factor-like protein [Candidatus Nealsonbacteria bacterium]
MKDVVISFTTSSKPGGQRRNKKRTAVVLHHLPSGITVRVDEQRLQSQNKKLAFQILQKKLKKLHQRKKKRIATRVPRGVKEKRLQIKKQHSQIKRLRRNANEEVKN